MMTIAATAGSPKVSSTKVQLTPSPATVVFSTLCAVSSGATAGTYPPFLCSICSRRSLLQMEGPSNVMWEGWWARIIIWQRRQRNVARTVPRSVVWASSHTSARRSAHAAACGRHCQAGTHTHTSSLLPLHSIRLDRGGRGGQVDTATVAAPAVSTAVPFSKSSSGGRNGEGENALRAAGGRSSSATPASEQERRIFARWSARDRRYPRPWAHHGDHATRAARAAAAAEGTNPY